MKVILFVTKYPQRIDDSYLPSEIADEWSRMGHDVTVVVTQWENKGRASETKSLRFPSGVQAHYFAPLHVSRWGRIVERVSRWGLTSYWLRRPIRAAVGPASSYDAVVFFAPVAAQMAQVADYAGKDRRSYLYITDFFPFAAKKVGLIPKGPYFRIAHWLENRAMLRFRTLGTMSPRNAAFLRAHYRVDPQQSIVVDMLWGPDPVDITPDRKAIRARHGVPQDRHLLLFGGQLSEGRGVDDIIAAAEIARRRSLNLCFVVIGDGRLRSQIEEAVGCLPEHLCYLPPVPRDIYLELASACDLGLVVTVRDTNVPTFPSRTIDYLRVGLPVLAAVETTTDFGTVITELGLGASVEAGRPEDLVDAAFNLLAEPRRYAKMREACVEASKHQFHAARAAQNMLEHAVGDCA
jgi:glycosyltransferase involved in cell wall biosynthesis